MSSFSFRITLLLKPCLSNEEYLNKVFEKVNYSSISSGDMSISGRTAESSYWNLSSSTVCDRCLKTMEKCLTKVYTNTESIVHAGVQSLYSRSLFLVYAFKR